MNREPFTSPDTAAADINVLTSCLLERDTGRYLYRGQIMDYPSPLVPAIFRGLLDPQERYDATSLPHANSLRSLGKTFVGNYAKELSKLSKPAAQGPSKPLLHRKILFEHLLNVWGYALGSTLAQHYGVNSGFLDASTDITVAAYFATHTAPSWKPAPQMTTGRPVDPPTCGVIYRFTRKDSPPGTPQLGKDDYWSAPGTIVPEELLVLLEDEVTLEESWKSLRYSYEMFRGSAERCWELPKIPRGCAAKSRVGRQKAAFIVPDELHVWRRPQGYGVGPIFGELRLQWEPELQLQAIEDLGERQGTTKYYFRHTACTPPGELSPDYLWPDRDDPLLLTLRFVASDAFSNYRKLEEEEALADQSLVGVGCGDLPPVPQFMASWDDSALSIQYAGHLPHANARLSYLIRKSALLCSRGYLSQREDLLRVATNLLQNALTIDSDSVVLLLLMSMVHHDLGEHAAGATPFNQAIDVMVRDTINAHGEIADGLAILQRIGQDLHRICLDPKFPELFWEYYQSF